MTILWGTGPWAKTLLGYTSISVSLTILPNCFDVSRSFNIDSIMTYLLFFINVHRV